MSYTKAQVARLQEFETISYAQAGELAVELSQSLKSVISKAQHLEIPYIKKAVPAPKEAQATKAEILAEITKAVDFDTAGLAGATRDALVALNAYVNPDLAV